MKYIYFYRLYHEEFRTNEVLSPIINGNDLVFEFRGFQGSYNISVMLENGTILPINKEFTI